MRSSKQTHSSAEMAFFAPLGVGSLKHPKQFQDEKARHIVQYRAKRRREQAAHLHTYLHLVREPQSRQDLADRSLRRVRADRVELCPDLGQPAAAAPNRNSMQVDCAIIHGEVLLVCEAS